MFSPDMMQQAQAMMANMTPEDMKRMTDMAASMDPTVMESMMKNMGGGGMPSGVDPKTVAEQMKKMSPEQMRQGMTQAQSQMGAQKQYLYNASVILKNEGNEHIKHEKHAEALLAYNRALENLKMHSGDDVVQLRLSLLLNAALCHLKHKDWSVAVQTCDEAIRISAKSFKAIFRRGLAKFELGQLLEAITDIKLAAMLSPEDKTIAAEMARVVKECTARGLGDEELKSAEKAASSMITTGATSGGGGSSGSGAWPTASPGGMPQAGPPNMAQAVEQLSKNPEMLSTAMEAMRHIGPDEMDRMLSSRPLPPGMDAATMRKQLEVVRDNPEMMRTAMEALKSRPEEERRNMLGAGRGAAGMGGDMSRALENPEMLKQMAEMAKSSGASGEEADMMQRAAQMMTANPDLGKTMSDMLKNMPPEQMQKMMEMSSKMHGARKAGASGSGPPSMDGNADMAAMMNDPDMMKAAEEMMKNITPETLSAMARAQGMEIGENQAKMIGRLMPLMPWVMKGMRAWGYVKRGGKAAFSPKGRVIIAVIVVFLAVMQHYVW